MMLSTCNKICKTNVAICTFSQLAILKTFNLILYFLEATALSLAKGIQLEDIGN